MGKTIYIDDGDALNIDRVIVNMPNTKWCKVLYSCDLIDEYEDRLKADMIAMLTELQKEIEELPTNRMAITDSSGLICYGHSEYEPTAKDASKIIQQKIDSLKENKDEKK